MTIETLQIVRRKYASILNLFTSIIVAYAAMGGQYDYTLGVKKVMTGVCGWGTVIHERYHSHIFSIAPIVIYSLSCM